jgi:hypothetical protein
MVRLPPATRKRHTPAQSLGRTIGASNLERLVRVVLPPDITFHDHVTFRLTLDLRDTLEPVVLDLADYAPTIGTAAAEVIGIG